MDKFIKHKLQPPPVKKQHSTTVSKHSTKSSKKKTASVARSVSPQKKKRASGKPKRNATPATSLSDDSDDSELDQFVIMKHDFESKPSQAIFVPTAPSTSDKHVLALQELKDAASKLTNRVSQLSNAFLDKNKHVTQIIKNPVKFSSELAAHLEMESVENEPIIAFKPKIFPKSPTYQQQHVDEDDSNSMLSNSVEHMEQRFEQLDFMISAREKAKQRRDSKVEYVVKENIPEPPRKQKPVAEAPMKQESHQRVAPAIALEPTSKIDTKTLFSAIKQALVMPKENIVTRPVPKPIISNDVYIEKTHKETATRMDTLKSREADTLNIINVIARQQQQIQKVGFYLELFYCIVARIACF